MRGAEGRPPRALGVEPGNRVRGLCPLADLPRRIEDHGRIEPGGPPVDHGGVSRAGQETQDNEHTGAEVACLDLAHETPFDRSNYPVMLRAGQPLSPYIPGPMSSIAAMSLAFALGAAPQGNSPPVARAGADAQVACELDGAAAVSLDGTASSDPDSTPGTNDDIKKYRWTEGETLLAEAATASVHLTVGVHVVTLTVVDVAGAEGSDEVTVVVYDDAPPVIACPKDVTAECAGPHGAEVVWGAPPRRTPASARPSW